MFLTRNLFAQSVGNRPELDIKRREKENTAFVKNVNKRYDALNGKI